MPKLTFTSPWLPASRVRLTADRAGRSGLVGPARGPCRCGPGSAALCQCYDAVADHTQERRCLEPLDPDFQEIPDGGDRGSSVVPGTDENGRPTYSVSLDNVGFRVLR